MRTIFLLSISVLVLAGMPGCKKIKGKGDVTTEDRNVTGFSGISLSLPATLYFTTDSSYSIKISAQENLLEYIETNKEGSLLVIELRDHYTLGKHEEIVVTVRAPGVHRLDISGSGSIYAENNLDIPGIELNISGSGDIHADSLISDAINANISGSGSMKSIGGRSETAHLVISGSGSIDFRAVKANSVSANISGSGNIYCWAVNTLDATISGSGDIYYNGEPQVTTHISGSGNVGPL